MAKHLHKAKTSIISELQIFHIKNRHVSTKNKWCNETEHAKTFNTKHPKCLLFYIKLHKESKIWLWFNVSFIHMW